MKKIFILALLINFFVVPIQAYEFDLNKDFNSQLQFVSYIHDGYVVGVSTYLSVREQPSVYSREIMRIQNGTRLELRAWAPGWYQVLAINGNRYGVPAGDGIGFVSAKYIQTVN